MRTILHPAVILAAALSLAAPAARGQLLYSNDFSSTSLPNATANFILDTGNGVLNYVINPGGANITDTASVEVSGSAGSDFVVTSRFTVNNFGTDVATVSTFGFGVLSSSANFITTSPNSYYLVDWGLNSTSAAKGQLRILAQPSRGTFTTANGDSDGVNPNGSSVVNGKTYQLRLTGTYTDGTLSMTFGLYDDLGVQIGTVAMATDTSPLAGQFFGYRSRAVGSSGLRDVSYDYFSVALPDSTPQPPAFAIVPVSQNWLSDANVPFSVLASGAEPISYQWLFNGSPILDATNATYVVSNAQPAQAGNYSVIASNAIGTNTCPEAVLTIRPRVENGVLARLWSLSPAERSYLKTTDTERGLAYNAASNHVLLLARETTSPGPASIFVLDGDTGGDLGQLDTFDLMEGTFWGNVVGVAEDGAVYAANLVQNPTTINFRIYRWASDEPGLPSTRAYDGTMNDIVQRWGDTLAVRGSGPNTQIIIASENTKSVAVFTTTDGTTFTPVIMTVTEVSNGAFAHGLAFGAGNTFWGKARNGALYHCSFNLTAGTASVLPPSYAGGAGTALGSIGPIASEISHLVLAGVSIDNPDNVQLYNVADLNASPMLAEQELFPTDNANTRYTGALSFGNNRLYALGTANGIMAFSVDYSHVPAQILEPPSITTQPVSLTNWAKLNATFSVAAAGYQPLAYQWYHEGNVIADATSSVLVISNAQPSQAGTYWVVVTNAVSSVTSSNALLTLKPAPENGIMTQDWVLSPGALPYLTTGSFQRGLACNPVTGNLLLASRAGGSNTVAVLAPATGGELGFLDTSGLAGGSAVVNAVGIADDGVIYVANIAPDALTEPFKIYRWANEDPATMPTVAYEGAPGNNAQRWGDTLSVRGSGADTQIIASSSNTNTVAIFTTADGINFVAHYVLVSGAPAGWLNQGLAFGEGNTFWAKSTTASLLLCAFDLNSDTASLSHAHPAPGENVLRNVGPIGYSASRRLLVGVGLDTPDHVQLYKPMDNGTSLLLIEQEFFPTDFANSSQAGAVAFGSNRLYVLDSNNGILAFDLDFSRVPFRITQVNGNASDVTIEWESQAGVSYQVQYKDSLDASGWSNVGAPVNAAGLLSSTVLNGQAAGARFYRVQSAP